MTRISNKLIKEFGGYCIWVNTIWKIKRILYDDNPKLAFLFSKSNYPYLLSDIGQIIQSYLFLSVIKLHDPAIDRRGNTSLTLEYMINNGPWNKRTRTQLEKYRVKLDNLVKPIKVARDKILAHRDIKTIEDGKPLGRFGKLRATRYFNILQKYVNIVGKKSGNGIFPFNNAMPINDARVFLNLIINDTQERHIMGWPEDYTKNPTELNRIREKRHEVFQKKEEYEKALKGLLDIVKEK